MKTQFRLENKINFLTLNLQIKVKVNLRMGAKCIFSGLQIICQIVCTIRKMFAPRQKANVRVLALHCFAGHVRTRDDTNYLFFLLIII